jgi:two-component system nitrogen regulation response regulator NtrX
MENKIKILIVDDEENIRISLKDILEDEGYEILLAENAQKAKDFKSKESISLILLDIWMPDCDGITLLKEWSKEKQLNCPVIMMSGHGTIDTAIEATKIGAFDFLEKPISLQKLLKTISSALKKVVELKRLSPDFIENNQHPLIQELKSRLTKLKKENIFFLKFKRGKFLNVILNFLYGNDFYLLETKKNLDDGLLKFLQDKGINNLVFFDNEISNIDSLNLFLNKLFSIGLRALIINDDEKVIEAICGKKIEDIENSITFPGNEIDNIPELANAILTQYTTNNLSAGYKEFDVSALNFLRTNEKFLDINFLDEVIYLIMTGVESDIVSADDIRGLIGDNFSKNEGNLKNTFYDISLKEARDLFEKEYFEYHLAKNVSISEIAKIADVERTHLYRKLKQLGIKTK